MHLGSNVKRASQGVCYGVMSNYAMCPPRYIYNCVGLYRHTQVYIYIIYNNNIYFYALL